MGGGGSFKLSKFNFQDLNLMHNFTAIPNPASYFGYNHLSQSFSALRNAMIETLKMPKMAKLPRLNSENDAQIRKKFRFVQEIVPRSLLTLWKNRAVFFENLIWSAKLLFFSPFFQASRLGRTFSDLSKKFELNGIWNLPQVFFSSFICDFVLNLQIFRH